MPLQKDHNHGHIIVFGQARKLPSDLHYHGKVSIQGLHGYFRCLSQG